MLSIEFVFFFFPLFMGIYALSPPTQRSKLLLIASLGITAWIAPKGLIPLTISVLSGYLGGIVIYNFRHNKKKQFCFFITTICINVALLAIFFTSNYLNLQNFNGTDTNYYLSNGILFGIISYSFHSISYCTDIYKGKYRCENSFFPLAAYIAYFPVMTAGPLLKYDNLEENIKQPKLSSEKISSGIWLFLVGLSKKLILSNGLFQLWQNISSMSNQELSPISAWIGILIYFLGIYLELLAYSEIARGISLILGIDIPENFNFPFTSHSFTDFAGKFNCTLNIWCQDYIYNPLNGRKPIHFLGGLFTIFVYSTWFGLSSNKIIFFFLYAILLALEMFLYHFLSHIPNIIRCLITNILLLSFLPIFAFDKLGDSLQYISAMLGINKSVTDTIFVYLIKNSLFLLIISLLVASGLLKYLANKLYNANEFVANTIKLVILIFLLAINTAYIISENSQFFTRLF